MHLKCLRVSFQIHRTYSDQILKGTSMELASKLDHTKTIGTIQQLTTTLRQRRREPISIKVKKLECWNLVKSFQAGESI